MSARYVHADEPGGAEYHARVLRPRVGVEAWGLIRDDSRNGGSATLVRVTREQWHGARLDGVFVPVVPERQP